MPLCTMLTEVGLPGGTAEAPTDRSLAPFLHDAPGMSATADSKRDELHRIWPIILGDARTRGMEVSRARRRKLLDRGCHRMAEVITEVRRVALLATVLLTGCASQGAPSLVLFGAYFPAWMFCALIGFAFALAARAAFIMAGLDAIMSFRLFSYSAIAVMVAATSWLIWYGPMP